MQGLLGEQSGVLPGQREFVECGCLDALGGRRGKRGGADQLREQLNGRAADLRFAQGAQVHAHFVLVHGRRQLRAQLIEGVGNGLRVLALNALMQQFQGQRGSPRHVIVPAAACREAHA